MKKTETLFKYTHHKCYGLMIGDVGDWVKVFKRSQLPFCKGGLPSLKIEYLLQVGIIFRSPETKKEERVVQREYTLTRNEFLSLKHIISKHTYLAGNTNLSYLDDVLDDCPSSFYFGCDDFYGYINMYNHQIFGYRNETEENILKYSIERNLNFHIVTSLLYLSSYIGEAMNEIVNFFKSLNIELPFVEYYIEKPRDYVAYPLPKIDEKSYLF